MGTLIPTNVPTESQRKIQTQERNQAAEQLEGPDLTGTAAASLLQLFSGENNTEDAVESGATQGTVTQQKERILDRMRQLDLAMPPLFTYADLVAPDFSGFESEINKKYFEHEAKGRGAAYLVALSSFKNYDSSMKLDHREVQLQLNIAKLVNTLTRAQKELFGTILGMVMETAVRRSRARQFSPDAKFLYPEIPRNAEDIRRLYSDGKYAILTNVPRPFPKWLQLHAVVSIYDCVSDFLAHGVPCRSIPNLAWFHSMIDAKNRKRKLGEKAQLLTVEYVFSFTKRVASLIKRRNHSHCCIIWVSLFTFTEK